MSADKKVVKLPKRAARVTHPVDRKEIKVTVALVLSSAHVSTQTMEWIGRADAFAFAKGRFGAFVHRVTQKNESLLPEDLYAVLRFASRRGFSWVRFDVSGPVMRELPVYPR